MGVFNQQNTDKMADFSVSMSRRSVVFSLDDLSIRAPIQVAHDIAAHLLAMVKQKQLASGCCVSLPSLTTLSKALHAPYSEVKEAFQILKAQGHTFIIPGYTGSITLWLRYPTISFPLALEPVEEREP